VTIDLPRDDDSAGLNEYARTVVDAISDRTGLVLVAQSFGGFTASLVCERVPVDLMVLVAAMIPREPTMITTARRDEGDGDHDGTRSRRAECSHDLFASRLNLVGVVGRELAFQEVLSRTSGEEDALESERLLPVPALDEDVEAGQLPRRSALAPR
jgi:hypothetical protein